jgi:putative transposase
MKVPADVYARSPRVYRGLEELTYAFHDHTIAVTRCGRICFKRRRVNLNHVFGGQNVGVTPVAERIWLVPSCTTIWATSMMRRADSN